MKHLALRKACPLQDPSSIPACTSKFYLTKHRFQIEHPVTEIGPTLLTCRIVVAPTIKGCPTGIILRSDRRRPVLKLLLVPLED